jgi:hypothetical protein
MLIKLNWQCFCPMPIIFFSLQNVGEIDSSWTNFSSFRTILGICSYKTFFTLINTQPRKSTSRVENNSVDASKILSI